MKYPLLSKRFVKEIGIAIAILAAATLVQVAGPVRQVEAGASDNLGGFAWGGGATTNGAGYEGIGWVSFNNLSDGATTSTYGVNLPASDGNITGYAWSEHYGWLSFNTADLSNCPSGTCAAYTQGSAIKGWSRILSISEAGANAGGWSGWVSLSGAAQDGSPYGVSVSSPNLSGYGWSDELGWIDFSGVRFSCANGANNYPACNACASGFTYNGTSCVASCAPSTTSWSVTSGSSGSGFSSRNRNRTTSICSGSYDEIASGESAVVQSTGANVGSVILSCTNGTISQSNRMCTRPAPPPTCSTLTATPSDITTGGSVSLSWSCQNAASCTAVANSDGFSTGGAVSGTDSSVTPSITSGPATYALTCGASTFNFPAVTVHSPSATISAAPSRVPTNSASTITWSSADVTSCAVSGPGLSSTSETGAQAVTVTKQSTYTITCQTAGSPVTDSVTVNVTPSFQEF